MTRIFIHGSGHRADSWRATVEHMRDGTDILCPDLRDILGGKAATHENLCAAFADYCAGVDGKLRLCGLSLGGVFALEYALCHPEKVASLVLIGVPCKVPKLAFAFQSVVFRFMPECAFDGMAFDKEDTAALNNTLKNLDFTDRVGKLTCPALIVCGEKDGSNMNSAKYMASHIPGARLEVVSGSGHVVSEDNPAALARLLDAWYAGLDR